jgi:sulfur carrier protein
MKNEKLKVMKLKLNGTVTEFQDITTVADLLNNLRIEPRGVAVEVNLEIIRKHDYNKQHLRDGDAVEIVNFVGGG